MLIFKPNGQLDIATAATDLPGVSQGKNEYSEALTRCKNLRVTQKGKVSTRDGSSKLNSTAINTAIWLIHEMSGDRYTFAGTNIYKNETSIASGLTSAQWSSIAYNAYNDTTPQIFALNGTDRKRITGTSVNEWGITAPTSAPTLAVGASSGLTGDYNAKYTYIRKSGTTLIAESNPSPAGTATTLANESLSITWTASSDSQVTHVRIYRTLTNGAVYYVDQDVAIGTTTLDTNTADAALGALVESDNDRPPLGSYVAGPAYDGTCFIIKDNLLYFSKPKEPESWPSTYYIEVSTPDFPGQLIVFQNGQPYFITKNNIFYIQGTGQSTFFPIPMQAKTGAQSSQGAVSVDGHGIYHVGRDGIYLFSNGDKKVTEQTLDPLFRGETVNGMPGVQTLSTSWIHRYGNNLYFGYQSAGTSYPTNVLIFNLDTGRITYYVYNDGSDVEIRTISTDEVNKRLLIGDNTGYVRHIEDKSKTTDSGTDISFDLQSKDFTLQTRAHFPRYNKYDIDGTCTGELILDDVSHQTHPITGVRSTKRRLIKTGNGSRVAIRVYGSGVVDIYGVESE